MRVGVLGINGYLGSELAETFSRLGNEVFKVDFLDALSPIEPTDLLILAHGYRGARTSDIDALEYVNTAVRAIELLEPLKVAMISSVRILRQDEITSFIRSRLELEKWISLNISSDSFVIFRLSNIIGRTTPTDTIIGKMLACSTQQGFLHSTIEASGASVRDYVYIDDFLSEFILKIRSNFSGVTSVRNTSTISNFEVRELLSLSQLLDFSGDLTSPNHFDHSGFDDARTSIALRSSSLAVIFAHHDLLNNHRKASEIRTFPVEV